MTEDDAVEMIYEHQDEQLALDTVDKLENRETHSVLEAEMVKGPRTRFKSRLNLPRV